MPTPAPLNLKPVIDPPAVEVPLGHLMDQPYGPEQMIPLVINDTASVIGIGANPERMTAHPLHIESGHGYVRCVGRCCALCEAGYEKREVVAWPMYVVERRRVEVLVIDRDPSPASLFNIIAAGPAGSQDMRWSLEIRRCGSIGFVAEWQVVDQVTSHEAEVLGNKAADLIDQGLLDPRTAVALIPNETLRELPQVRAGLILAIDHDDALAQDNAMNASHRPLLRLEPAA